VLAGRFGLLPLLNDVESCVGALQTSSVTRCREAFGVLGCPLEAERARAACGALPVVSGGRDDRIAMLP
jgi:hypothetical protein